MTVFPEGNYTRLFLITCIENPISSFLGMAEKASVFATLINRSQGDNTQKLAADWTRSVSETAMARTTS